MKDTAPEKMEVAVGPVSVPAEMPDRASEELAMLGLSPEFPERLQEMNAALADGAGNGQNNFIGYKFILSPDTIRPVVEAKQKYQFPFSVELDVSPAGRAKLELQPKYKEATLTSVRVDQLQSIFGNIAVGFSIEVFEPFSDKLILTKPLEELTEEDIADVNPISEIRISAHDEPAADYPMKFTIQAAKINNRSYDDRVIPTLRITGIEVEGSSSVVEGSLETITRLAQTWHARP